ncbi:MAG: ATP-binding protein [Bacteroidales bacterium]|nr:ATP-binding protein [Bacteroidales bacterium]
MLDYDFKILQPSEFECFSRDLLQARENIFIESFADGPDKGIDFRFAYNIDQTCIIQCKRDKEWNELKSHLKKEADKVKRLNPQRYILTTSVDLSVNQKKEIREIFSRHIKKNSDILGRKDLNNLLNHHKEIEKDYHKLWLASTNVLNLIINKDTVNWSTFELENIKRDIRLYVENKSLNEALEILKKNHYVIISGIPGIGKTTLARMLVYSMLAQGFDEFVYITDDIDNAAKMFEKEKRQIFFFDDFLGSNSFIQQSLSFENKLVSFIEGVRNSANTLFILSTREYVLSEAMTYYEKLSMSNIELAKCTIQLEYYTKSIKARILYNHLAEADIPAEYINAFIDKHSYRELIEHKNFNPRVIESIIKKQIWNSIAPNDFTDKIKEFFDSPVSVWQFAFEKLDVDTRYALLVLGTMNSKVMMNDFQEAYKTFCKLTYNEVGLTYDDLKWRKILKVLMNCFIKTESKNGVILVSMYNPSIADFVVFYLSQNSNTVSQLMTGACFIEQLYSVFTDNHELGNINSQICIGERDFSILNESFDRIWNQSKTCRLDYRNCNDVNRESFCESRVLFGFMSKFPSFCEQNKGFVEKRYDTDELCDFSIEIKYRIGMIGLLDWDRLFHCAGEFLRKIIEEEPLNADEWIEIASVINKLDLGKEIAKGRFYDKIDDDLKEEIEDFSYSYECDDQNEKIDTLRELLPDWNWRHVSCRVEDVEKRLKEDEEEKQDEGRETIIYNRWKEQKEKEDFQIDEMFSALRIYQ